MFSKDNSKILQDIYNNYNDCVKPLLANLEACVGEYPIEITNEIRALFDHISRCYLYDANEDSISRELQKAYSHIYRIELDCYKHMILHYHDNVQAFRKDTKGLLLTQIDNGTFYPKYYQLYDSSIKTLRYAKEQESKLSTYEEKLRNYEVAFNEFYSLNTLIEDSRLKVDWANVKHWSFSAVKVMSSFVLWFIGVILGALLTNNNPQIVNFILKHLK